MCQGNRTTMLKLWKLSSVDSHFSITIGASTGEQRMIPSWTLLKMKSKKIVWATKPQSHYMWPLIVNLNFHLIGKSSKVFTAIPCTHRILIANYSLATQPEHISMITQSMTEFVTLCQENSVRYSQISKSCPCVECYAATCDQQRYATIQ